MVVKAYAAGGSPRTIPAAGGVLLVGATVSDRSLAEIGRLIERGQQVFVSTFSKIPPGRLPDGVESRYLRDLDTESFPPAFWRAELVEPVLARRILLRVQHDPWTRERALQALRIEPLDAHGEQAVDWLRELPQDPAALDRLDPPRERWSSRSERLRRRADRLAGRACADLGRGRLVNPLPAYAAEIAYADALFAAGEEARAAGSLLLALRLAFHRSVHLDSVKSPLADSPSGFTAPLWRSQMFRLRARARGRRRKMDAPGSTQPTRVAVIHQDNPQFLGSILDHLRTSQGLEVRLLGTPELGDLGVWARETHAVLRGFATGDPAYLRFVRNELRPLIDWADVVFVEWCSSLAFLVTRINPGACRIVVRMHSYEGFTVWPHLIDYSRVDTMLFVSEHQRDLSLAAVPAMREGSARIGVLANAVDLTRCIRPKADAARFVVGVIGIGTLAKDVLWAFEVFRLLRSGDARYRLVLVGEELGSPPTAAAERWLVEYRQHLEELSAAGEVEVLGHQGDIPTVLEKIGVILNTSVREGQPVALAEAAASGAVPVVRDWPFFNAVPTGPRTLFPDDWVVGSPAEAVQRILAVTISDQAWRAASSRASAEAVARFDASASLANYHDLFAT